MNRRTRAVHAGAEVPTPGHPVPAAPDLAQATADLFRSLEDLEEAYAGRGMIYRRYGSENQALLESAMADLESEGVSGDVIGLAASSGMAAMHLACVALTSERRVIVGAADLYGGTRHLFTDFLPSLGFDVRLVDFRDPGALTPALDGAGLLVVETIANPALRVADIPALATAAHAAGALLLVDNTFATPFHCRPLALGADVVSHSTTKYISGHGDAMGGVLVSRTAHADALRRAAVAYGPSPGPLDSWLALRGLRTLTLRMEVASASAARVAAWLERHPAVESVDYPGLPGHASHAVATRVLDSGFGAIVSFHLRGGHGAAAEVCSRMRMIPIMPSLADVATTVSHPFTTSHRGMAPADLDANGVTAGMIRLSVGIEDTDDIVADLELGLGAA